jgi:hypothetical protein
MTGNLIPLNKDTAKRLTDLHGQARKSVLELADLASQLRHQYKDDKGDYSPEFKKFYLNFDLEKTFGKLPNFTKYANAGDVREKFGALFEEHQDKLPITIDALNQIGQLDTDEIELCLTNTYSRDEVSLDKTRWRSPKKPTPLIKPTVTAGAIKSWRENWRQPKPKSTDKRRLPLAEIKLHGSFLDMKNGRYIGLVPMEQVELLAKRLTEVISEFDSSLVRLDLHTETLKSKHEKKLIKSVEEAEKKAQESKKKTPTKNSKPKRKSVRRLSGA